MAEPSTAQDAALGALHHRDLSASDLERRLAEKGFDEAEREDAIAALQRTGILDDRRFAESRAQALAARGAGDRLIRHELVRAGVEVGLVDEAIALLEPEVERALRIGERRGSSPKTARYLRGKGFSEDSLTALVATGSRDELG